MVCKVQTRESDPCMSRVRSGPHFLILLIVSSGLFIIALLQNSPKWRTQSTSRKLSEDVSTTMFADVSQKTAVAETTTAPIAGASAAATEAHVAGRAPPSQQLASSPCSTEVLPGNSRRNKPPFFFSDNLTSFVDYAETPRVSCREMRYFGGRVSPSGLVDGDKAVCLAPVFDITPGDCIVYSFGISNEWSFDDAMAQFGCQVYAFDPTMGVADHNKSERVHFYNLGLGPSDTSTRIGGVSASLRTLGHIMDMLGHTNKMIDYVKIDIEGYEYSSFEQLSKEAHILRQLGIEVHPGLEYHGLIYDLFVLLEYLGFTTFDARRTPHQDLWYTTASLPDIILASCYELAWAQVDYITW
ncbi:probable methyltransferase-like protein 24 isoform X2 [Panulirus ornatus]|uniref:probable methyltransferase-like protein 24 isoform X2 n=1 Tax=Panulirus ornatus TaxID=150431 RepID=UPI003A886C19